MIENLILVAILILVGGFFAASEIALITVKRHRLSQLADEGNRAAQIAQRVTEDPSRFLATIQIAITFLGFLAGAVGAVAFSDGLANLIRQIPIDLVAGAADTIAFVVMTLVIALLSIIGGLGLPFGPIVGSVLMTPLDGVVSQFLGGGPRLLIYGAVLLVVVLIAPRGVLGTFNERRRRR